VDLSSRLDEILQVCPDNQLCSTTRLGKLTW
jgi:hypothetical protein